MGLTHVTGVVSGPSGGQSEVEFLVDSGATYTVLPAEVWRALGLAPKRPIRLVLADGTGIERQVSECHIKLEQGDGTTPVIMGEPGDQALLGAVTLEILGFVLNPFTRELIPMQMMLG